MKASIEDHKLKIAKQAEANLPLLMANYKSGDLESLGKLCNSINTLAEFYLDNLDSDMVKRIPRLMAYLDDKFKNCIVLILKKATKNYSYTANNITKFIRGESLHGASDNQCGKRKTLHEYVFEKNNDIDYEFQISWNWIAGPNLRSSEGHIDSGGPFVHAINFNDNRIEVSLIEAVIISIAFEFWQANTNNQPEASTKVFVKFNPDWFVHDWGQDLATKVKEQLSLYHGVTVPENDT